MKKAFSISLLLLLGIFLGCSGSAIFVPGPASAADDADAVDSVIDEFQTAYSAKKIADVQNLFHYKAVVGIDFYANNVQEMMTISEWITSTKEVFKEKSTISDQLTNRKIDIYRGSMATVICDYNYRDQSSHQTGVDVFTLMKIRGKWKIISLIFSGDTAK